MRLGISSYTYVWSVGVPGFEFPTERLSHLGLLRKAVALSVQVVQIADNLPLHLLNDQELDAFSGYASDAGISLELGTCGVDPGHLQTYVSLAKRLSAPILRLVTDTDTQRPTPEEIIDKLSSLKPQLNAANVCLAIENHDRFKAATLRHIVEQCDSPHIGICLDTANSLGCGEGLETVVAQLAPWVVNLHIKDFQVVRLPHLKGFIVEGRPAGQGQVDIPWLIENFRHHPRRPNAILELWPPPQANADDSVRLEEQWALASVEYLRQHILA